MKSLVFLCTLFCFCGVLYGQYSVNSTLRIPASETYSSASIARFVQAGFNTDRQKISAIYNWVTTSIRYDKDSMYYFNWGPDPSLKVSAALRRKKGVCENFASVFTDIALKCGIPSFVVSGYARYSGSGKAGHSWSAVYLDSTWLLCDPTWDIGAGDDTHYFLVSPEEFIETHMPFDPLWQLLPYPSYQKQMNRGASYNAKKKTTPINVNDSVKAFLQLDSVHQLEASSQRMQQAATQNDAVNVWRSYVNMKIAIVYGDKDMELYNAAVADLNRANAIFNDFVQYRNNQFTPLKPDAAISAMLDPIPGIISSAYKKIDKIGATVENFQYDTGTLKGRLGTLTERVLEQQKFLKKYFESSVAERGKLFYK